MSERSLAGRALVLLPFVALASWSGNATLRRMERTHQPSLAFVTGSMDDTIADTLETGDLVFFSRDVTAMHPLAALHTLLLRHRFQPRFDHVGFIYVDRMGVPYVVEETLRQVQCRPYSARILTSEASEIVVVPLKMKQPRDKQLQEAVHAFVDRHVDRVSRVSLRQTVAALLDPDSYHPAAPETTAPLFPSAALVAEAYEAMGLVDDATNAPTRDPRVSKATLLPRQLVAKSSGLRFRAGVDASMGSPLPIRLH